MKYIYAALMLHESGKEINEENLRKVVEAIGEVDEARLKVVVESLKGVNIEEAIKAMPAVPVVAEEGKKAEVKEEKKEEKKEEYAAEGLAALFG
jgi:large subunit ribosomal protein L12